MGKGRRERVLPLWKETVTALRDWLKVRGEPKATALFLNARGDVMTRSGFEYILEKHVRTAGTKQASLTQETGFAAQFEAFVRHAHSARDRRHSEGLSLARPRNPPKHGGLSESRSHGKAGGHGVFGSADLTTRSLPAAGQVARHASAQKVATVMRRPGLANGRFCGVRTAQLRISMDGAYFLPSIASTATRMRICGVI